MLDPGKGRGAGCLHRCGPVAPPGSLAPLPASAGDGSADAGGRRHKTRSRTTPTVARVQIDATDPPEPRQRQPAAAAKRRSGVDAGRPTPMRRAVARPASGRAVRLVAPAPAHASPKSHKGPALESSTRPPAMSEHRPAHRGLLATDSRLTAACEPRTASSARASRAVPPRDPTLSPGQTLVNGHHCRLCTHLDDDASPPGTCHHALILPGPRPCRCLFGTVGSGRRVRAQKPKHLNSMYKSSE